MLCKRYGDNTTRHWSTDGCVRNCNSGCTSSLQLDARFWIRYLGRYLDHGDGYNRCRVGLELEEPVSGWCLSCIQYHLHHNMFRYRNHIHCCSIVVLMVSILLLSLGRMEVERTLRYRWQCGWFACCIDDTRIRRVFHLDHRFMHQLCERLLYW